MTAVALIMLGIGVLMLESAIWNTSIQQAANAVINGAPPASTTPGPSGGGGTPKLR